MIIFWYSCYRKATPMTDTISKERRSWVMSQVKSSGTTAELAVRSILHKLGYRFRLYDKSLPGTPDIVLKKHKAVVMVNGCFWHGHSKCKKHRIPTSNREYWTEKIQRNVSRDKKNCRELGKLGWDVITVWECELANRDKLATRLVRALTPNLIT